MVAYGEAVAGNMLAFYGPGSKGLVQEWASSLILALHVHDLGKVDPANQEVLAGHKKGRLPVDHIDAGVAVAERMNNHLAAWLVRAHHSPGLASKTAEKHIRRHLKISELLRGARYNRSQGFVGEDDLNKHLRIIGETDGKLDEYLSIHERVCGNLPHLSANLPDQALTTRLLMSCLVDADHSSAASYSSGEEMPHPILPDPMWDRRLKALEQYILNLPRDKTNEENQRNNMRQELFQICLSSELLEGPIVSCAAPVGLGKTTAVVAYLLRVAKQNNLRRIFVVAPFTNIISQTVKRLRAALVLDDEQPEQIVAEHHHRLDLGDPSLRQYSTLWKAPIIVTTAVQFFESLASAQPSALRKIHNLPGSGVFIDESHACLPPHLMRQTWHWINLLAKHWSCYFVLASGSLVRFWKYSDIVGEVADIPEITGEQYYEKARRLEKRRVQFARLSESALSVEEFLESLIQNGKQKYCSLIILNTVQSAAVVAQSLAEKFGEQTMESLSERRILHLSTALAPFDREKILDEIKLRQSNLEWKGRDWYLVATSCVEAGVDLDFDLGYRERCSVTSFFQTAGRINRHGVRSGAILYDFCFAEGNILSKHPGFRSSANIFSSMWSKIIDMNSDINHLSTLAICREAVVRAGDQLESKVLYEHELSHNFQEVNELFRVIDSDTVTAIVNPGVVEKIRNNAPIRWTEIQNHSVQIWKHKLIDLKLDPIGKSEDLFLWTYAYDPLFLGYMKGLLPLKSITQNTFLIV